MIADKLWIWRAYDPITRRTIAWVLGRRDDATCQKLLDKIGVEGKTFVTDDWEGYHRLIPESQLFTGKDLSFPIEQDNSNIRHFLARFRRRTKVVSKVAEMVDLSLRIYHHFQDNHDNFIAKAAVFRSIFSYDSPVGVRNALTFEFFGMHADDQHFLVVGSVENRDAAAFR